MLLLLLVVCCLLFVVCCLLFDVRILSMFVVRCWLWFAVCGLRSCSLFVVRCCCRSVMCCLSCGVVWRCLLLCVV